MAHPSAYGTTVSVRRVRAAEPQRAKAARLEQLALERDPAALGSDGEGEPTFVRGRPRPLVARVQEPALAGTEERVQPVLDEGAEARLEVDLREDGVLGLLEAVEQVLADAVGLEDGRGEVALLHPRRREQHEAVGAHRGRRGEDAPERLGAGQGEDQVDAGARRRRPVEHGPQHRLGLGQGEDLRRADVAAEHARAQRGSRANAEHLAKVAKPFAGEPRGAVGRELVGSEEEEVHRRWRSIPAQDGCRATGKAPTGGGVDRGQALP